MSYLTIQKEETLKAQVFADHFDEDQRGYTPNIGNIDFIVTSAFLGVITHLLWAEAKKGVRDIFDMLTQLILTCKKTYDSGGYLPPPFIGCFDAVKIAFVPFHDILPIFADPDVNWNATPSNYLSADFLKLRKKVEKLIEKNIFLFNFDEDSAELKDFIRKNIVSGGRESAKSPITKNNFTHIFYKWVKEVKPTINLSQDEWSDFKKQGIEDCDFFRADMMSSGGNSIVKKLKILLEHDNYTLEEELRGRFYFTDIDFTDRGAAYRRFWNRYDRPPAEEYQQYIIDRRDLLVPQNIREVKGSFYTPAIWVEKSQEYLAAVFGADWQDEYYIWDCAAGIGNLLAGLTNKYNIWASDIDAGNINTMRELIDSGLNLLPDHVFQFDFLNDILTKEQYEQQKNFCAKAGLTPPDWKLPEGLRKILDDPEKRKKLIVYINPPYAETDNRKSDRSGVKASGIADLYGKTIGKASNELFAQFMARIHAEIPLGKLAQFSTLKYVNAPNFVQFREFFKSKFKAGFVVPADTFDNVHGKFPIGFLIWDMSDKETITQAQCDVYDRNGKKSGVKTFYALSQNMRFLNTWLQKHNTKERGIGILNYTSNDMQQQGYVVILSGDKPMGHNSKIDITKDTLIPACVYLAVRHCIEADWLNDRDQFLFPNNDWETDIEFQNDCLIFTLFHGQNRISSQYGINHWIPFTEAEVGAKEKFESDFMSSFLKEKMFSAEAQAVLQSGLALWKYYHGKIKTNRQAAVNASFYDIREFFQGRKDSGTMRVKSTDETYNALIKALREAQKTLASKIEPKVYEYGFLKE